MTEPDVKKEFGAAVREHRLRLGFSQEALGERAELHRTYITDVERGARNLSLESISKLARALEVPIGALFARSDSDKCSTGRPKPPAQAVRILLVEDDPKDAELTLQAFGKARLDNQIEVVHDGAAALEALFGRGEAGAKTLPLPSIILLDLGLPKLHGLEVLRRIKADERTRKIHVVVLTGSRNDAYLQEALQLGADAFIVKPVDFRNFSSVVAQFDFNWALLAQHGRAAVRAE